MRYSFLFLLIFIFLPGNPARAQDKETVKVNWSETNRLTNLDFKAFVPNHSVEKKLKKGQRNSTLEGYIYSGVGFVVEQKGKTIWFNVQAFMEPAQSWLRDTSSATTLEHEQAHFDITEIYARKMRKELYQVKSVNAGKKIYQKLFKMLEKEQTAFDKYQYGEEGVTSKWKSKIVKELSKLKEFASPQVMVQLH